MRKIFLFISAVMMSVLSLQAEIIFSGDAHNTGSWNAKQMPIADFPVLAKASAGDLIVITVSEAETGGRICLQNTAWAGLGYDEYNVVAGVYPFVLTAEAAAEVNTNGLIVTGEKYTFSKVELLYQRTLWTGSVDATDNWQQSEALNNDLFAFLKEGDFLGVTVSEIHESEWHQYSIRKNYETNIIEHLMNEAKTGVDRLSASVVTSLKTDVIILVSSYLHATAIHTYDVEKGQTPLWTGEKVFDNSWGESVELASNKLSSLTVGDRICLNISALSSEGQVQLMHNWTEFEPKAAYVFNANHAAPMTVSFVINQDMLTALQADGLRVRGANYTVQDIYIQTAEAQKESYTLEVKAAGMATLVLPFNVPNLPEGVQAYKLTNDGLSDEIVATEVSAIEADKPVLIVAEQGFYTFESELGGNADISGKNHWPVESYLNGALVGNYAPTLWVPQTGAPHGNNYVLQKHGEEAPAFYKVNSNDITLSPYRAYLSCGYNATASAQNNAPMRIVFHNNTTTGVETITGTPSPVTHKILRNGQLFILRNGVEYNMNGQMVK